MQQQKKKKVYCFNSVVPVAQPQMLLFAKGLEAPPKTEGNNQGAPTCISSASRGDGHGAKPHLAPLWSHRAGGLEIPSYRSTLTSGAASALENPGGFNDVPL